MGALLDACPLLVELVVSLEGSIDPFFRSLVFDDKRPRGQHLRALVLLCDLGGHIGPFSYLIPNFNRFSSTLQAISDLVTSRRKSYDAFNAPALLERFIIRFTDDTNLHNIGFSFALYRSLQEEIGMRLQSFVEDGLQLSVEATSLRLRGFKPFPSGRHWGEGVMDFVDHYWELTTAMPSTANAAPVSRNGGAQMMPLTRT